MLFDRILGIEEYSSGEQSSSGGYFDNTTITFGKYIGNDLFLEMLLRLYGGGEIGLQAEILISLEWPTPFFTLDWTLAPSVQGLDELFVRDNTFTFKWLYSY